MIVPETSFLTAEFFFTSIFAVFAQHASRQDNEVHNFAEEQESKQFPVIGNLVDEL